MADWTQRLRLRNLQVLLSLARTENMSHSATELHTTQPGLSKFVKEMEDDIGLPLFERHARGLRPTPYGQTLIEHARRIEAHLDTARDELKIMRNGAMGLVTLGFAGASGVDTVPMAVLQVRARLPGAHIRLVETRPDALMADLSAGLTDLVVGPSGLDSPDVLIRAESLYVEPIHIVCRPKHPLFALERPVTWDDILSYPWALWARGTPVREAFDKALYDAGQHYPPSYIESNSATLTTTLLVHSDMVGVASHRPALRYKLMRILSIVPFKLSTFGSVSLYWREDAALRPAVAVAIEAVRQVVHEFSPIDNRTSASCLARASS